MRYLNYRGKRREAIAVYRNTAVIYNPSAGKLAGKGKRALEEARALLEKAGGKVSLVATTGPGTAGALARRAIAQGADLILAAGGDGTVNEMLEGVVGSPVAFGVLPAGTANVLATEAGIPASVIRAAHALADYVPKRVSVGRLARDGASRHFLCMAGIGLDAHVVYHLSAPLKAKLGKAAYWVSAFSLVGRDLHEFEVTVDGRQHLCSFALVSKVKNYGGDLTIASGASLLDDRFEVVLFEGRRAARYLKYLAGLAVKRLKGMSGVEILRARRVEACCSPDARVYIQVDGEYAGRLPVRIEVVPDSLTLLLPPGYGFGS